MNKALDVAVAVAGSWENVFLVHVVLVVFPSFSKNQVTFVGPDSFVRVNSGFPRVFHFSKSHIEFLNSGIFSKSNLTIFSV